MVPLLTAFDLSDSIDELFVKGQNEGSYIGFQCLRDYYSVKSGCTTYIGGIPANGKTEFALEIMMNLSEQYGWRHAIFTPETGSNTEIMAELIWKYIRKPFDKKYSSRMSEQEMNKGKGFVTEYFTLIEGGEGGLGVKELLSGALDVKNQRGLDCLLIDPWNELSHDFSKHGGREDKYLEFMLGRVRRFAREHQIHVFIVAHPRTLQMDSKSKYDPPTAFQLSGGAAWYAKAESIICVHRMDRDTNESAIIIQKAKPKIIGKKGEASLFYDWHRSRYYEQIDGNPFYAFEGKKYQINNGWLIPATNEEKPF